MSQNFVPRDAMVIEQLRSTTAYHCSDLREALSRGTFTFTASFPKNSALSSISVHNTMLPVSADQAVVTSELEVSYLPRRIYRTVYTVSYLWCRNTNVGYGLSGCLVNFRLA